MEVHCRENAPISSRLNAIDLYLVVCIFLVFGEIFVGEIAAQTTVYSGALMEYAVILLLLKKRRKPMRTIDQGLRHLFAASNGAAAVPLRDTNTREVCFHNCLQLKFMLFSSISQCYLC